MLSLTAMARDATGDMVDFMVLARRFMATEPTEDEVRHVMARWTAYVEARETITGHDPFHVLSGKRIDRLSDSKID